MTRAKHEICDYHADGVGWDECSDGFQEAPCAVARLKTLNAQLLEALQETLDVEQVK